MRFNGISVDDDGKCISISYFGPEKGPFHTTEYFSARVCVARKAISISSLGGGFTFAQVRVIATTLLRMVEDNK